MEGIWLPASRITLSKVEENFSNFHQTSGDGDFTAVVPDLEQVAVTVFGYEQFVHGDQLPYDACS